MSHRIPGHGLEAAAETAHALYPVEVRKTVSASDHWP